ncbi:UNVERIFIED_CONTAM: hypothetical protein RMT77_013538 [Armadillidium vulgare]
MSSHLSLQALRAASQAQDLAEKRAEIRRKSLLILVHNFLKEEGYDKASFALIEESKLNTECFTVCENVNLTSVLEEYETWFVDKFNKFPRFARRVLVTRPLAKPHVCNSQGDSTPRPNAPNRKSPFFRRKSTPQPSPTPSIGRAVSEPNISSNARGRRQPSLSSRGEARRREEVARRHTAGARRPAKESIKSPSEEKKDSSKSSSDTDSERGIRMPPAQGGARPHHQILDLKSMIRDYTRLEDNIGDIGKGPRVRAENKDNDTSTNGEESDEINWDGKFAKPPPAITMFTGELRDLALIIQREILVEDPGVHWSDILGVEDAKRLVKEAVVYPLKYPQLFVGRFKPWRGILLYGPPGTGKTLLAKAVATECRTTFFNISATTLVSKWRGDSEKLVRVLFEMARHHAPSTIFVDEVDALMASRQGEQEHEASRRMKTQLLVEMDGLTRSNDRVFLLAASNIPWELDPAMLRRLEKRILVPLPSKEAREMMFGHHLPQVLPDLQEAGQKVETRLDYQALSEETEGYSGSDLQIVCREAAMSCLRKVFNVLEDHSVNDSDLPDLKLDTITMEDVRQALKRTKPAQNDNEKYTEWHKKFGSA